MKECPKIGHIGDVMSNFDHEIEEGAELKLKAMDCHGSYPAVNFYGLVWYEDSKFYCQVKQYGSHVATVCADSLQGIMDECCERFGRA